MSFSRSFLHGSAGLAAAFFLAACAAPLRDARGLAIVTGEPVPPSSVARFQADLGVLSRLPEAVAFSARLYGERSAARAADPDSALPSPDASSAWRFRLDVLGFPSSIVATWMWREGNWILVRHDRREATSGEGSTLQAEGLGLRVRDLPAVLAVLAGDVLPGYPGEGAPVVDAGSVRWRAGGAQWEATIDPRTGLCGEVRSPDLTLRYARYRRHGGVAIPEETQVLAGEDARILLNVREWKASPAWKKDPFELFIPAGYERR